VVLNWLAKPLAGAGWQVSTAIGHWSAGKRDVGAIVTIHTVGRLTGQLLLI